MPPKTTPVTGPAWAGPCDPSPRGGVTVSLLQKFLSCRKRFGVYAIEGWRAAPRFSHRIFYGCAWHAAEEAFAKTGFLDDALLAATHLANVESRTHPVSRQDIDKWANVVYVTFPEYVRYWSARPEDAPHVPVAQEQVFRVPYTLPSGRVVHLRGKFDGVTRDADGRLWLFETKTKSEVDQAAISRQLTFDIQTATYAVALTQSSEYAGQLFAGVRFNVIRRPLSGGKGTIVRHKPTGKNPAGESEEAYYDRLRAYIANEPETYFFRWACEIGDGDLAVFRREFLDPCLEFLCAWYELQTTRPHFNISRFDCRLLDYRTPFGLTSEIVDGYGSDLDGYLDHATTTGLVRTQNLFPELT